MPRLSLSLRSAWFIANASVLCVLCGCQQKPTTVRASGRSVATNAFTAAHVQSLPLYHQAQQACSHKQYRQAAALLARLSSESGLSPQERAFCREQQSICLKHAGLPASPVAALAAPPAPAASPHPLTPEQADCGPRALRLVCERLGAQTSLPALRQMAHTSGQGTSLEGLAEASKKLGFKAEGVQVDREALSRVEMPAIAWVNADHYVAVFSTRGEGEGATAVVQDPNKPGEETIPQEKLLRMCSGYLLLVHR